MRSNSTFRTIDEAITACKEGFQQIPTEDLSRYFDHVKQEEDRYWRIDGLMDIDIAPVIIPVYDSDDDDENGDDSQDEFEETSSPNSSSGSDEFL